jgi:hypothetical protein
METNLTPAILEINFDGSTAAYCIFGIFVFVILLAFLFRKAYRNKNKLCCYCESVLTSEIDDFGNPKCANCKDAVYLETLQRYECPNPDCRETMKNERLNGSIIARCRKCETVVLPKETAEEILEIFG